MESPVPPSPKTTSQGVFGVLRRCRVRLVGYRDAPKTHGAPGRGEHAVPGDGVGSEHMTAEPGGHLSKRHIEFLTIPSRIFCQVLAMKLPLKLWSLMSG